MFRPGSTEIVVGSSSRARHFAGVEIGQATVVRASDAGPWSASSTRGKTAFDSEIWGDVRADDAGVSPHHVFVGDRASSRRPALRLADAEALASDPRLTVEVKREAAVLRRPVGQLSNFITLPRHDAVGDLFDRRDDRRRDHDVRGGRNAHRRDRHAARAGFPPRVDPAGVPDRVAAAGAGRRVFGLFAASFLQALTISTTNFQSFSELAFCLYLDAGHRRRALVFSIVMGFVGGFLPAIKASRMKIVDALRAA